METAAESDKKSLLRRNFLNYLGAASVLLVTAAACKKDDTSNKTGINLGSGDIGILNYAYAPELLEAAIFTQVIMSPYGGITGKETALLTYIRDHEIAHREFLKQH